MVIILDLPGHGGSDILAETHSMELMATLVDSLLNHLNVDLVTVVGHSMGGYISLALAEKYEDRVKHLVLINSTPLADSEESKKNRNRALQVIDKTPRAYIGMAIGNLFAEASKERFFKEIEDLKNEAYTFPREGLQAAIRGMRDRKDRTEVLKNFPRDKYMLLAEEDPIMPISTNVQIAENTNTVVKIVSGGHMSSIENRSKVQGFLLMMG